MPRDFLRLATRLATVTITAFATDGSRSSGTATVTISTTGTSTTTTTTTSAPSGISHRVFVSNEFSGVLNIVNADSDCSQPHTRFPWVARRRSCCKAPTRQPKWFMTVPITFWGLWITRRKQSLLKLYRWRARSKARRLFLAPLPPMLPCPRHSQLIRTAMP